MNNEELILETLAEIKEQITDVKDSLGERLDNVESRLGRVEDNVFAINEQLPSLVTKDELKDLEDRVTEGFEEQATILKRLDEERYAIVARQDRLEAKIDALEK